jgi:hypothetical protein
MALLGCENTQPIVEAQTVHNPRICQPIPPQGKGEWGACIHRNAYKYARADDPAEVVAKAVSSSCGAQVAELVNTTSKETRVTLLKDILASMDALSLEKIIEARAGNCDVPEGA